jgi:hypothetical protein
VWVTRLIDYTGVIEQALRDLVAWVEHGTAPPKMQYHFSADNALELPPSATERGGIQPVVHAVANGGGRADVAAGETVTFEGSAELPSGTGTIIGAEWDFDGTATWPVSHSEADGTSPTVRVTTTHRFDAPGSYFPAFRVSSHRHGRAGRGAPVQNLARVRVVVHEPG